MNITPHQAVQHLLSMALLAPVPYQDHRMSEACAGMLGGILNEIDARTKAAREKEEKKAKPKQEVPHTK